jgi:ribosome-associated protein
MAKTQLRANSKKVKLQYDILTTLAIHGIQEKKGEELVYIDFKDIQNAVADCFLICHAESGVQIAAIAQSVEETIYKSTGEDPYHKEGLENSEWVILDYFNLVIHIFQKQKRNFYGLERLWGDAQIQIIE